jgi:hypothetical protein
LHQGIWAVPPGEAFDDALARAVALVERGEGDAFVFEVTPTEPTMDRIEELFTAEREAEWVEFVDECGKFEAEIAREIAKRKLTLAELDEEEQNLDRLKRWYRELRARDLFGARTAAVAEAQLKECEERLEDFAERVFEARQPS